MQITILAGMFNELQVFLNRTDLVMQSLLNKL